MLVFLQSFRCNGHEPKQGNSNKKITHIAGNEVEINPALADMKDQPNLRKTNMTSDSDNTR
jgi:hypothetical protein